MACLIREVSVIPSPSVTFKILDSHLNSLCTLHRKIFFNYRVNKTTKKNTVKKSMKIGNKGEEKESLRNYSWV